MKANKTGGRIGWSYEKGPERDDVMCFQRMISSLCTRRGFKGTAVCCRTTCSWSKCCTRTRSVGRHLCTRSNQSTSNQPIRYIIFSLFSTPTMRSLKPRLICRFYKTHLNTARCQNAHLKHNTCALQCRISICIACSTSISTHVRPVTMATKATWLSCGAAASESSEPLSTYERGKDRALEKH